MPTPDEPESLLLDTHVWLWLLNGDDALKGDRALALIERAGRVGRLGVSAISLWEVAMLGTRGRIRLAKDCHAWMNEALAVPGMAVMPLTPDVAVLSARLPGKFHGDPADRIIVATALVAGAKVVTRDREILAYAKKGFVAALTA
jgi:PIN domain nuclease of toxin-antitoxin system